MRRRLPILLTSCALGLAAWASCTSYERANGWTPSSGGGRGPSGGDGGSANANGGSAGVGGALPTGGMGGHPSPPPYACNPVTNEGCDTAGNEACDVDTQHHSFRCYGPPNPNALCASCGDAHGWCQPTLTCLWNLVSEQGRCAKFCCDDGDCGPEGICDHQLLQGYAGGEVGLCMPSSNGGGAAQPACEDIPLPSPSQGRCVPGYEGGAGGQAGAGGTMVSAGGAGGAGGG